MLAEHIDKIEHIVACTLIGGIIGTLLILLGAPAFAAVIAAIYSAEVAAVTKEWSDQVMKESFGECEGWSWADFAFDQIGVAIAAVWPWLMTLG